MYIAQDLAMTSSLVEIVQQWASWNSWEFLSLKYILTKLNFKNIWNSVPVGPEVKEWAWGTYEDDVSNVFVEAQKNVWLLKDVSNPC